jgi:hypothetical protein
MSLPAVLAGTPLNVSASKVPVPSRDLSTRVVRYGMDIGRTHLMTLRHRLRGTQQAASTPAAQLSMYLSIKIVQPGSCMLAGCWPEGRAAWWILIVGPGLQVPPRAGWPRVPRAPRVPSFDPGGGCCVLVESFDELHLEAGPATARYGPAAFAARHEGGLIPPFGTSATRGCHRWSIVWPGPEHTAVLPQRVAYGGAHGALLRDAPGRQPR